MRKLIPTHVVFNGKVGALTGKNAMTAKVGETVMIVHSQANRDTRPHLIGGHGDYVWETGKFINPPEKDLETWFIRGGSAGAALYTFRQPGIYAYVNHNLIEAVELGASAHFKVEGEWNNDLMKQVQPPGPIPPGKSSAADAGGADQITTLRPAAITAGRNCNGGPAMLLAMKIKIAITAAALASPVALTVAPVARWPSTVECRDHRNRGKAVSVSDGRRLLPRRQAGGSPAARSAACQAASRS